MGNAPTFEGGRELARYIDPDERNGDGHAAASAFLPIPEDLQNPDKAHLSVNSTEVEPQREIAEYFRAVRQDGQGDVALYVNKIQNYVNCGRKADVRIRSCSNGPSWVFDSNRGQEDAFKHRPVKPVKETGRPGSPSHSGIEFIRAMNGLQHRKFARLLAKKPRYHIFNQALRP